MPDLLVEIGCEELPASACREALAQTPPLVRRFAEQVGLPLGELRTWVAPRRIAFLLVGLPAELAGEARSVRGPAADRAFGPDGAPTRAGAGFARGQGVDPAALVTRAVEGRAFVFAEHPAVPRALRDLVPELAAAVVDGLRFSKNMRWGDGTGLRFSRPVRWLVAKLDAETVPFTLHGLRAGDISQGHRFLGAPTVVDRADRYLDALREVAAVADQDERRSRIVEGLDAVAESVGCAWSDPGGKLDEVLHLVESPSVVAGAVAEEHLRLPERVLVTAMQSHQRYFPLHRPDGTLHAGFLAVSNGDPAHAGLIGRGYEDVLEARLQDAAFSFDRDRDAGLAALDARLDAIVFHQRLGTLAQKRDRLRDGVASLGRAVGSTPGDLATARAAAGLAKADQGAVLVAEFSDLQGYVAAEYARLEGHDEAVCVAIAEQFLPEGPSSPTPSSEAAALLACAEKLDNLVGAFAVGEAPTGSKDPYGLRRAAAGLVRVVLERRWEGAGPAVLRDAHARLAAQGADLARSAPEVEAELADFLEDRIAAQLAGEGVGAEAFAAARGAGYESWSALADWARQVQAHRADEAFLAVWTASTRCQRIVTPGEEGAAPAPSGDPGEAALAAALAGVREPLDAALTARDLPAALAALAPLAAAVDRFFADVMVNADDAVVRRRRHGLLRGVLGTFGRVADFARITQGGVAG